MVLTPHFFCLAINGPLTFSFQAGIYVWQHVHTYLSKDRYDSGNMIECVELLKTFKVKLPETERTFKHQPSVWTMRSFRTCFVDD